MSEKIQNILRSEGTVEFEGVTLKMIGDSDSLLPGDTYVAQRNQGPKLLTVREIAMNAVFPVENAYPYDLWECVKVEIML
jgi:hypothetical protein